MPSQHIPGILLISTHKHPLQAGLLNHSIELAGAIVLAGPPPEVLELNVNRYTTNDTSSIAKSFANLDELSKRITWALQALESETPADSSKPQQAPGAGTNTGKAGGGTKTGARQQPRSELEAGPRPERVGEGRPERVDEFTPARPFFDMDPLMGGRPRMPFPEEGPFPHPLRAGEGWDTNC